MKYPNCLEFEAFSGSSEVSTTQEDTVVLRRTLDLSAADADTDAIRVFGDLCDELESLAAESETIPSAAQMGLQVPVIEPGRSGGAPAPHEPDQTTKIS